jgi:hypothetical protein
MVHQGRRISAPRRVFRGLALVDSFETEGSQSEKSREKKGQKKESQEEEEKEIAS